MEFAAGAILTAVVGYQGFVYTRSRFKATVNCWFCNKNCKVEYRNKNSFVCPSCEQYNGFTNSGDYNKDVGGARRKEQRFCVNSQKPPDVIERSNGLCNTCNAKQSLIIEKLADFEAINEDKWDDEYEVYKYKLDKLYPLCGDCTILTHQKLQGDKRAYGYLLDLKYKLFPAMSDAFRTAGKLTSKMIRRHRRQFFACGRTSEIAHWITLILSFAMFLTHLNSLQEDTEVVFLKVPHFARTALSILVDFSFQISLVALFFHFLAMGKTKCRSTFPDLLYPLIACLHVASFALCEDTYREDLGICRCAFSAFMTVLSSAVTILPRKRLHKRKPNRIIASAFSVASTPESQCSSQDELSFNDCSSEKSVSTRLTKQTIRNRFQWREQREMSPEIETPKLRRNFLREQSPEAMDWEPTPAPSVSARNRMGREETPARELAPSLSSLSIAGYNKTPTSVFGHRNSGQFPSFSRDLTTPLGQQENIFDRSSQRDARSVASGFTSVSRQLHSNFGKHSPPAPSVFTSVSQQAMPNSPLTIAILFALVISSLLGNIAFVYYMFRKESSSS